MQKISIITACIDLMSVFNLLTPKEQKEQLQLVIDTLGSYPKPQTKDKKRIATHTTLSVYLYTSNARNYCKLGLLGLNTLNITASKVNDNLENALTLLID
jgi:hypothetical protein